MVLFAVGTGIAVPVLAQVDEAAAATTANGVSLQAQARTPPVRYTLPPPSNFVSTVPAGRPLVALDVAGAPEAAKLESNTSLVERARGNATEMVLTAMNFLGVRYKWGGESVETGFDCSGFTRQVFERSIGLLLPRRAEQQAHAPGLTKIVWADLKPGDLVFFNTLRKTFSHVGIYVGDGKFIHAPHTGATVRVDNLTNQYWSRRFTGGRRADQAVEQDAALSAHLESIAGAKAWSTN